MMAIQRITLSYDDERHTVVSLGLANHAEDTDSAYIRKAIEFYELNKGSAVSSPLILERLATIERLLRNGVTLVTTDQPDDTNDALFDNLLEQL
jgi:hypothetical protein